MDRGINIIALYGRSDTVDGIRALKHMGFEEIPSVTNYKNFMLKMDGPETKVLQRYIRHSRERK
jgi:hypothetical protein